MRAAYSKQQYRKTLFQLRAIVKTTERTLLVGDSDGQEYCFLDQVSLYEQLLKEIEALIDEGLHASTTAQK